MLRPHQITFFILYFFKFQQVKNQEIHHLKVELLEIYNLLHKHISNNLPARKSFYIFKYSFITSLFSLSLLIY